MTEAELAAIRARHPQEGHDCPHCQEYNCADGMYCAPKGVCDSAKLLTEVERLRGALERILAEHVEVVAGDRTYCPICAPGDGHYPCVTVLEARAALGVGNG